jgi:hypothetical protein
MSIIEENLQAIHDLENDLKLDLEIFKYSVEAKISVKKPKSRPESDLNKDSNDIIKKSLSDRILRSTIVSALTKPDESSKFVVEILIFFLQEMLNTVKRERRRS